MKKLLLFIIVTGFITLSGMKLQHEGATSGIAFFEGSWAEALQKAKKEKKHVFLDISASWCGPCKMLKRYSFTNAEVGEFFNKYYVNVEVDGERGEGVMLANKYHIDGYPSLFFLDTDEKILMQAVGYRPPNDLLGLGKRAINQ